MLAEHHRLVRGALAEHEGNEVGTQGDGFFAVFESSRACVAAAVQVQRDLDRASWPNGEHVRARMGVHTGEATQTPTGLVGLDVHRAARVAGVAHGGQVLLSGPAAALVEGSLPPGAALVDLGLHRLKDLGQPEHIFQVRAEGLRPEFPPLRSLENPTLQNNLPYQPATFIGRRRELAEVTALIAQSRLVTLAGAGGSGKTRLALQVAADLLDGAGDGVWLVELASLTDEEAVAPAIASALRIASQPGQSPLASLLEALAPQRLLLILDNCEHLVGACAKVADSILRSCPRVHLLATSREPLGIGGEAIYRVPSLSLPTPEHEGGAPNDGAVQMVGTSDAIALFFERARAQGVELASDRATLALAASVCRRLDGMPLAIELAAARLRSLSLANLHDRLDQRFRLLTGGSRSAMERQQTLRATVDWSYSLLNGAEQSVLRRLSVFAEGFDIEAAEAVCASNDLDAFDVADLLGSLVDKSLVITEAVSGSLRYRLLETVRQYAAERLAGAGPQETGAAVRAHLDYFLALAEQASALMSRSGGEKWFARLDLEQANFRRAADRSAEFPDGTRSALRLWAALGLYWWSRAVGGEAKELIGWALDAPDAGDDPALLAKAFIGASLNSRRTGINFATDYARRAISLARQIGQKAILAEALAAFSAACFFVGELNEGLEAGREAASLARALGDDPLLAFTYVGLCLCASRSDVPSGARLYEEALACCHRGGNAVAAYPLNINAAVAAMLTGDYSLARQRLEAAARVGSAIGAWAHYVPANLGLVLMVEGDPAGALAHFTLALRSAVRSGERAGVAYSFSGLACACQALGDPTNAALLHGVSDSLMKSTGEIWQEPEAAMRQANMELLRGQLGAGPYGEAFTRGSAMALEEALEHVRPVLAEA